MQFKNMQESRKRRKKRQIPSRLQVQYKELENKYQSLLLEFEKLRASASLVSEGDFKAISKQLASTVYHDSLEIAHIKSEISLREKEVASMEVEHRKLEENTIRLEETIESTRMKCAELEEQASKLIADKAKMDIENAHLFNERNEFIQKIDALEVDNTRMRSEKDDLTHQIQKSKDAERKIKEQLAGAISEQSALESVAKSLKDKLSSLEDRNKSLSDEVVSHKEHQQNLEIEFERKWNHRSNELRAIHDTERSKYISHMQNLVTARIRSLGSIDAYSKQLDRLREYKDEIHGLSSSRTPLLISDESEKFELDISQSKSKLENIHRKLILKNILVSQNAVDGVESNAGKRIKVGGILDEYSFNSFAKECELIQLKSDNFQAQLEEFSPDFVFITSSFGDYTSFYPNKSDSKDINSTVANVLKWCENHKIPRVLWSRDEPGTISNSIEIAKLVDFVFTTDFDNIARYRSVLGHERVYLLAMGVNPAIHNPVGKIQRNACCLEIFTHANQEDALNCISDLADVPDISLTILVSEIGSVKDLVPVKYADHVSYDTEDNSKFEYNYAFTFLPKGCSQSWIPSRIFELLASNTLVFSSYSRGTRLILGDLVISSSNAHYLNQKFREILSDVNLMERLKLLALREIMQHHTYESRFAELVTKVLNVKKSQNFPLIVVVCFVRTLKEVDVIVDSYRRQQYENAELVVIRECPFVGEDQYEDIDFKTASSFIAELSLDSQKLRCWSAVFSSSDYYGPNYLIDLFLTTRFTEVDIVGKGAFFEKVNGELVFHNEEQIYHSQIEFSAERSLFRTYYWLKVDHKLLLDDKLALTLETNAGLTSNQFNYISNGYDASISQIETVSDLVAMNPGLPLEIFNIDDSHSSFTKHSESSGVRNEIKGSELINWFNSPIDGVKFETCNTTWKFNCQLMVGRDYFNFSSSEQLLIETGFDSDPRIHLETTMGAHVELIVVYLDSRKVRISHETVAANLNVTLTIPNGTKYVRFGLHFLRSYNGEIQRLIYGHKNFTPSHIFTKSNSLFITNSYPPYLDADDDDQVHKVVMDLSRDGTVADVFCLCSNSPLSYYEYNSVDIIKGSIQDLAAVLNDRRQRNVFVHFLNEEIWAALSPNLDLLVLAVWINEAVIQNLENESHKHFSDSSQNMKKMRGVWIDVLSKAGENLKLVFASKKIASDFERELRIDLNRINYCISRGMLQ